MDLTNRVAVVTGASSGIGEATAKALAAEGAQVSLAARREAKLTDVADQIEAADGNAIVVPTDVRDEEQVASLVEQTEDAFGSIDILVNNAATAEFGSFATTDKNEIRTQVEVNLLAVMNMTHAVLPSMLESGGGDIVTVSSVNAKFASQSGGSSAYTGTKSGVNGFCEALRQEVAADGVRVMVVMPGWVDTEMIDAEAVEGDILDPADVAETIVFAVSRPNNVLMWEWLVFSSPPVPYQ